MLSWWFSSLFRNRQLNFPYFQKIDDDGQKMAIGGMPPLGIDHMAGGRTALINRSGFGQPSSCGSPRAAPEACHGPSPQCSASRLHRTAPAATTQRGTAPSKSARLRPVKPARRVVQEGAARLIWRRHIQRLGGCWRSTASTPVSGASRGRPAWCGWSRPAPPQAAAAVGEAPAF